MNFPGLTCFILLTLLFAYLCAACWSTQSFNNKKLTPTILWWQENLFPHVTQQGNENDLYEVSCRRSGVKCFATQDRNVLKDDSIRLLTVMLYGTDFRAYEAPVPRKKNHLWALLHEESPQNNHLLCHAEALSLFNYSATFKRESDFPLTTQHFPSLKYYMERKPVPLKEKNKFRKEGLAMAVYLQSNCDVPSDRDRYIYQLMANISVDSYGGCLHNKDFDDLTLMDTSKFESNAIYDILAKYKFHLAFENAICDDYITEKFSRPFHVGSVPVYRGSASARDWAPHPGSVIMVDDFESPASLAEYLNYLDKNDDAYLKYLEYKNDNSILKSNNLLLKTLSNRTWSVNGVDENSFVGDYECYVCEQMHEILKKLEEGTAMSSRTVPPEHLKCPIPEPSVGSIDDIPPNDHIHRWVEDYWQSLDQAIGLQEMVRDQVTNAESLWDYIEKRYSAGKGVLQHTEL
ncbi:GDP-fucose protein O-fucosyltransferase 4-like isoform X2 [Clavelina lepadiformis]|uniref:Fucosyltransferase n=1 Tax=Clavelina lepadiformis TaxID=159417 RepID=A0ABP0F2X8_CLALP